jgi:GNAT superfamily N-acetyltransferase
MKAPTTLGPPFAIRPAVPDDLLGLARVHVATWQSTYRGLVPDARLDTLTVENDIASGFGRWLKSPEPGRVYLVAHRSEGEIVGFAIGGPNRHPEDGFSGELGAIYILKEHQGQGIGSALVGHVARHLLATGRSDMIVWVIAENPYRRFYEKLGGVFVRERLAESRVAGGLLRERSYGWRDLGPLARR